MSDRKARLAALAAKAGRIPQHPIDHNTQDNDDDGEDNDTAESKSKPTLSFRNYVPKDASLDETNVVALDDDANNGDTGSLSSKRQKTKAATSTATDRSKNKDSSRTSSKTALEIALANTSREARLAAGQSVGTAGEGGVGGGWSAVVPPTSSTTKVNWDLKRDIQHKMDKLEKRTQRAIVQLLRERLEREAAGGGNHDGDDDNDEDSDID